MPGRRGVPDRDEPALPQVGEQNPDHAERKVKVGGEISHRGREAAQAQQLQVLGLETVEVGLRPANGRDHGHHVKGLAAGAGPAAGEGIRADDGPGVLVKPPVLSPGHVTSLRLCA